MRVSGTARPLLRDKRESFGVRPEEPNGPRSSSGRSRAVDAVLLQTEVAEAGMTVGSAAERPVVLALALLDRKVVD